MMVFCPILHPLGFALYWYGFLTCKESMVYGKIPAQSAKPTDHSTFLVFTFKTHRLNDPI